MAYRKKTLRGMKPVSRKLAKLLNDLKSVERRLDNLLPEIQSVEMIARAEALRFRKAHVIKGQDDGKPFFLGASDLPFSPDDKSVKAAI